jgi:hypothetical protein
MATRAAFEPGDRVRKGDERATVTYFHKGSNSKKAHEHTLRVSVLPDNRSRSLGSVVWECEGLERIGVLTRTCPVCGEHHLIWYCPQRI